MALVAKRLNGLIDGREALDQRQLPAEPLLCQAEGEAGLSVAGRGALFDRGLAQEVQFAQVLQGLAGRRG